MTPDKPVGVKASGFMKTLLTIALLLAAPAHAGDNPSPFLGDIELKRIEGAPEGRFEIRLYHKDTGSLASYLTKERSYAVSEHKEYAAITSRRYSFPRKTGGVDMAPSFIIDYNLEVFQQLRKEIIAAHGAGPGGENLAAYVNRYIENKNYTRGFDVASRVAERKEGDCTEHAALLVSLMRMFKIPAKMAFGIKIFTGREGEGYGAFGHAWVEYLDNGKWKAADPTLGMDVDHTYIPLGVLKNEEMDYSMDLVALIQRQPYRVEEAGI